MTSGRNCASCGKHLTDSEYDGYGSWSYTCSKCDFSYNHSSYKSEAEQLEKFENESVEEYENSDKDTHEFDKAFQNNIKELNKKGLI